MKSVFQKLIEDLTNAKNNGVDVTFIQGDGWVKATTGKISDIIVTEEEHVIVINNKEFYVEESDVIFFDDTQERNYYVVTCGDSEWSLSIMI